MTIKVKGSAITLKQAEQPGSRDTFAPTTSLTGGIGFGLRPSSKVSISKLTMKVLR